MPTPITVRRNFVVPSLLEIEDVDFANWYSLGVWWSMFGDAQTKGPFEDTYLITNIARGILNGWYVDRSSGWFPMLGFKIGMVHGGWLSQPSDTLAVLTDPDFAKGYQVGRNYHYTEAIPEGRIFSDRLFSDSVHEWALGYRQWNNATEVFKYCLGCRIGELSTAVIHDAAYSSHAAPEAAIR